MLAKGIMKIIIKDPTSLPFIASDYLGYCKREGSCCTENMIKYELSLLTGTAAYMAPEVLMGEEPSYTSDFWSLGCVFYEMFAGKLLNLKLY